jgi:2-oxoglutarate dehydrogenase E1 component
MIDQFIAAGETKWNTKSGLVMLLPHGYDGNGPEHSSCRVERYLQLSDSVDKPGLASQSVQDYYEECNLGIVNCSTAAQYFHVLRRQMRRPFRKPLVVVAPKKLLKFAAAGSSIEDFADDKTFQRVINDTHKDLVAPEKVRRVVFCSGQVYYDLMQERVKLGINDVAILRVEQLSPWPFRSIEKSL